MDSYDPQARLSLHYGDLTDGATLGKILQQVQPTGAFPLFET
ncbi:hypothetical protein [Thermostichus vulcanus]|nr:hypothetical protein [Thermostichus vulcanus]